MHAGARGPLNVGSLESGYAVIRLIDLAWLVLGVKVTLLSSANLRPVTELSQRFYDVIAEC